MNKIPLLMAYDGALFYLVSPESFWGCRKSPWNPNELSKETDFGNMKIWGCVGGKVGIAEWNVPTQNFVCRLPEPRGRTWQDLHVTLWQLNVASEHGHLE